MNPRDPATGRFIKANPSITTINTDGWPFPVKVTVGKGGAGGGAGTDSTVILHLDGNLDEDAISELRRQIRAAGHRVPFSPPLPNPSPARVVHVPPPPRRRHRWIVPLAFTIALTWLVIAVVLAQNAVNR